MNQTIKGKYLDQSLNKWFGILQIWIFPYLKICSIVKHSSETYMFPPTFFFKGDK